MRELFREVLSIVFMIAASAVLIFITYVYERFFGLQKMAYDGYVFYVVRAILGIWIVILMTIMLLRILYYNFKKRNR